MPTSDLSVTILSPTTLRIVADGVASATLTVPNAERAAEIAREEFADWGTPDVQ